MAEPYEIDIEEEEYIEVDPSMATEEIQAAVQQAIEDAVDYIDNTISPLRATAAEYYNGEPLGNEQEGRSTAQTMDVRDTVQAMLPSLMRIFCGSDHVVEYAPTGPEDVEMAKQATDYVNYILQQDQDLPFIEIIYAAMKDALVKGQGFLKYYYDETESLRSYELENLDDQALNALNSDPDIEIDMLMSVVSDDSPEPLHKVRVTKRNKIGKVKVMSVPPEEVLINRHARSMDDAELVAHRAYLPISDLVEMGYDRDEMEAFATDEDDFELFNEEARERFFDRRDVDYRDPSRRRVLYVEAYVHLDVDGDGVSELRRVCCAGPNYEILRNDPADLVPIALFQPDPEPHTALGGLSIADLTMDIQRIKSAVLRSSLDSLAMSTHPRVGIVEGQASLEDVMNNEAGGVIRMRQPGAVVPFSLPFVGKEAFPMLGYLDEMRENRTGISRAADGLDPAALQSSTLMAVQQTVAAAQQRVELIARLFADGGMTQLYKGLLQLIIKHIDKPRMIRLRNQFVPMSPDRWSANMDVVSNVALGKGGDQERMAMLQQVAGKQEQILQTMGPVNPLVDMTNYYQTLVQMLEVAGFKDPLRFFKDPATFQPSQEPPKPDPNEALMQVQMQAIQADIQKKAAELELEREKMMREDDRRRDKDEADIALKAAEINARYGAQVDTAQIKANSDRDRELVKQLSAQRPNGI
tara:strand:+ start:4139 stop:6226 length:2088 start_codon:yes stop_codon:yes gene_type:complete